MPFYEYQCKSCGHELEAMQKVSDAPLRKCPECGKSQLQRLMSAPVFRLKGGGWYETDFKDKDKQRNLERPEEAPKETKETKETDSKAKDDKGTESKEVKTAESKTEDSSGKETAPSKDKAADKSPEKSAGGGALKATRKGAARARAKKKPIKVKRRR
ncbi:MAG TPA: zinc ribbon domain-containing protein [Steroidobacteraceae bacterium]|jgi:putative FmdB family regulatory protein|nr:zinc ribbon domain-containing protein [Steroidobacteraceae bacterium]